MKPVCRDQKPSLHGTPMGIHMDSVPGSAPSGGTGPETELDSELLGTMEEPFNESGAANTPSRSGWKPSFGNRVSIHVANPQETSVRYLNAHLLEQRHAGWHDALPARLVHGERAPLDDDGREPGDGREDRGGEARGATAYDDEIGHLVQENSLPACNRIPISLCASVSRWKLTFQLR